MISKNPPQKEEFKRCFNFLASAKPTSRNRELLANYFFNKSAKSPDVFYDFITYFKDQLSSSRDTSLKKALAGQYLNFLSQICERLGFFEEKQILDDFCFKIINPKKYKEISKIMSDYQKKSKGFITKVTRILKDLLKENGIKCEIKGRYKSLYSTHRKLLKKRKKTALKLKDLFAFRIVLNRNSTEQCFRVLDLLHDNFSPVVDYFKDYITIPKINGYQSLHTGLTEVIPNLDLSIEVQIRTKSMDDFAEKGLAAHWLYAKSKKAKMIADHLSSLAEEDETKKMVYFCSHKGDVFKMAKGSSIVDFAYRVHPGVGKKAKSALVNGVSQEIYYEIQNCDSVEVIKAPKDRVNAEWLNYAHSKYTRKKIYESIDS